MEAEIPLYEPARRSRVLDILSDAPWWLLSAIAHAALIVLLSNITWVDMPAEEDEFVITTELEEPEDKEVDLEKIKELFEEPPPEITEDTVIESPVLVEDIVTPDEDIPEMEEEVVADEAEFLEVEDLVVSDTRDEIALAAQQIDLGSSAIMGLGEGGGGHIPRGVTSYKKIMSSLADKLKGKMEELGKDLLIIWLIDASISMKDDQQAIKSRLIDIYNTILAGQDDEKAVKMSIVRFGKAPQVWLKPTSDIDDAIAAFEAIPRDQTGIENTMQAILYCSENYPGRRGRQRVIVLVSDERGDDIKLAEKALRSLRENKIPLFVIGREATFSSTTGYEYYVDDKGKRLRGITTKGPESVVPEMPSVRWGGWGWGGAIASGFGICEQSRLALYSGGSYYILTQGASVVEEEALPKKDTYDWELMQFYRPELCSPQEYERRAKNNPIQRTMGEVVKEWNRKYSRVHTGVFVGSTVGDRIARVERGIAQCRTCIKRLEGVTVANAKLGKLKSRRWTAHCDMALAQFRQAEYYLRQYYYALLDFARQGGSRSDQRYTIGSTNKLLGGEQGEAEKQAVISAFKAVSERHPRTPWDKAAAAFSAGRLRSYRVVKYVPPKPRPPGPSRPSPPGPKPI